MIIETNSSQQARVPGHRRRLLRDDRGQIALAFVALLGLVVLVTPPLMNMGEVARIKTRTAIAADSAALTGASYGSSAGNLGARRSQMMVWIYWIVQTIFFIPFCFWAIPVAELLLWAESNTVGWMTAYTNMYMRTIFTLGHNATMFMALNNADIDDRSGAVGLAIQTNFNNTVAAEPPALVDPNTCCEYFWTREGIIDEPSSVQVQMQYPNLANAPQVVLGGAPLIYWSHIPFSCILFLCIPVSWGWNELSPLGTISNEIALLAAQAFSNPRLGNQLANAGLPSGLVWVNFVAPAWVAIQTEFRFPSSCGYPWLIPIIRWRNGARPSSISNSIGDVTVTVTRRRQSGAQVVFWTMQYPDTVSSATAHYEGAHVRLNPFTGPGDRSITELTAIR